MALETFSASEAETITGRPLAVQRKDRELGLMEPLEGGKARFDVFTLAQMLALQTLTDLGVKPSRAAAWSRRVALHVAHHALAAQGIIAADAKWKKRPRRHFLVNTFDADKQARRFLIAKGQDQSVTDNAELKSLGAGALVVDLRALGERLAERAERPLRRAGTVRNFKASEFLPEDD